MRARGSECVSPEHCVGPKPILGVLLCVTGAFRQSFLTEFALEPEKRPFVVFHYFEKNSLYRDNLAHFLAFGALDYLDYLFVVQGDSDFPELNLRNASVLRVPNRGLDFGGISSAVQQGRIPVNRERYFFINSSVRGPFVPTWVRGQWDRTFQPLFDQGLDLVGTTMHSGGGVLGGRRTVAPHIQSASYALSGRGFRRLVEIGFYDQEHAEGKEAIIDGYEIGLSNEMRNAGFRFGSLVENRMRRQKGFEQNPTSRDGDPNYRGGHFGSSIGPYHSVFPKVNRNIYAERALLKLATACEISELGASLQGEPLVASYLKRIERNRSLAISLQMALRKNLDFIHKIWLTLRKQRRKRV